MLRRIIFVVALLSGSGALAQQPMPIIASLDGIGPVPAGATEAQIKALNLPFSQRWVRDNDFDVIQYTIKIDAQTTLYVLRDGNSEHAYAVQTDDPRVTTEKGANIGMTLAELKCIYPDGQLEFHLSETNSITFTVRVMWKSTGEGKSLEFSFDTAGIDDACFLRDPRFETRPCPETQLRGLETRRPLALELYSH